MVIQVGPDPWAFGPKTGPSVFELAQQGDALAQARLTNHGYAILAGGAYMYPWLFGYGHGARGLASRNSPAPVAPHLRLSFDTIGQTIVRTIGHHRVRLMPLWAEGINESGEESTSPTQTFAAALSAPIDPEEDGEVFSIWDGDTVVMNNGGVVSPVGWSEEDIEALQASLSNIQIFPGDEAQLPAATIVADKGASRVNAFRGIRYIIVPNYPIRSNGGGGLPTLTAGVIRTNDGGEPKEASLAVEFATGAS